MKSEISIANVKTNARTNYNIVFSKIHLVILPIVFLISRTHLVKGLIPFGLPLFIATYYLNVSKLAVAAAIILGMITSGGSNNIITTGISMILFCLLTNIFNNKNKVKSAAKNKQSNESRTVPNYCSRTVPSNNSSNSRTVPYNNSHNSRTVPELDLGANDLRLAVLGVISILLPSIIHVYARGMLLYDLVMVLFQVFIVFVMVFIMSKAANVLDSGQVGTGILTNEESISLAIVGALVISGFSNMGFLGFGVKNVICIVIIFIFGFRYGATIGATIGVAAGLTLSMSTGVAPLLIGCYAFCGLLSGVFKGLGKIGVSLGFVLGFIILSIYLDGSMEGLIVMKELILAIILFMAIPQKYLIKIPEVFGISNNRNKGELAFNLRTKEVVIDRLNRFSKTFMEVSKTFNEISPSKTMVNSQDVSSILDRVADRVCKDCSLCGHCWDKNFYSTYQVMFKIVEKLDDKGFIEGRDIPEFFINRCERITDFIVAVNNMYEIFKVEMMWKGRLSENRNMVSKQLEELSKAMSGLANEIEIDIDFKSDIEDTLLLILKREGIRGVKVVAFENKHGKYEVSVTFRSNESEKACLSILDKIISNVVGRKMIKEITGSYKGIAGLEDSRKCTIKYIEEEIYSITTGAACISKYNERHGNVVNGDSYTFINTSDGKFVSALSDGMGSGEKAAFQSRTTIKLIDQFMETGFDKDVTIKLINSILVLNSSDDYYSTIDLSVISLDNGKTEFVKIGSAPTYIKRVNKESNRIEIVKTASLPAGILGNMEIELVSKQLYDGDMLIMVTDGVLGAFESFDDNEGGENKLVSFLANIKSLNPQTVADTILDEAHNRYDCKALDDMTVIVIKFWKKLSN